MPLSAGLTKPGCEGRHDALICCTCALGIVHVHYWRALSCAETAGDAPSRARAFAEARRLAHVAVALATRARALQAAELQNGGSPLRGPTETHARRRPGHGRLRAA
jgi:hypothetical protein